MKSVLPKVMHKVGGDPMLGHVIRAAREAGADRMAVVVGPNADAVAGFVGKAAPAASLHVQAERRGTAHAVRAAEAAFAPVPADVLVLYGDTPLVTAATLGRLRAGLLKMALESVWLDHGEFVMDSGFDHVRRGTCQGV